MRISIRTSDVRSLAKGMKGDIERATQAAMRETGATAKAELRRQVMSAGLGQKVAKSWRDKLYTTKRSGEKGTAGFIWSKAPKIIDAFDRGAQITPVNGKRYLAIATKDVPKTRTDRGGVRPMTPAEVEAEFGKKLFFEWHGKRLLAFMEVIRAKNGLRWCEASTRRINQRRDRHWILMFTLIPRASMKKTLDIASVAERWTKDFAVDFSRRLEAR